jgi:hypothetical protein
MKEKNHKRKVELKKRRQKILLKKGLHKDLSEFLIKFWMANTQHPLEAWEDFMRNGHKGYYNLRGADLVKHFESLYSQLRDPKIIPGFWCDVAQDRYNRHTCYGKREPYNSDISEKIRKEFVIESDSLMSRLMELAFNLDYDE